MLTKSEKFGRTLVADLSNRLFFGNLWIGENSSAIACNRLQSPAIKGLRSQQLPLLRKQACVKLKGSETSNEKIGMFFYFQKISLTFSKFCSIIFERTFSRIAMKHRILQSVIVSHDFWLLTKSYFKIKQLSCMEHSDHRYVQLI